MASRGYSGTLKIGVLGGLEIGGNVQEMMLHMAEKYPNIRQELKSCSHGEMVHALNRGELDMCISLDLAFAKMRNIRYINIGECRSGSDHVQTSSSG